MINELSDNQDPVTLIRKYLNVNNAFKIRHYSHRFESILIGNSFWKIN